MVQSAGRAAASTTASGARRGLDAGAGQRLTQGAERAGVGDDREAGAEFAGLSRQRRHVPVPATSASTANSPGAAASTSARVLRPIEPVLPRMVRRLHGAVRC